MPKKNCTSSSRRRQKTFDITSVLSGVQQGLYIEVEGNGFAASGFQDGDMLLIDSERWPRKGDLVIWEDAEGFRVSLHEDMDFRTLQYKTIHGPVVSLIRDFRKRPTKKSPAKQNRNVTKLLDALSKLERLPENEAERFRLETEIYHTEQECERDQDDEWPEVIAA